VSHLKKTKTFFVTWLNSVPIVPRSVRLLPAHNARRPRQSSIALSMMVLSSPCQTCRKRCFSSQHLYR